MQNTINRSEYKNKSKSREYCKNRPRENEISHEKTKKFKNSNFIDFSKINRYFRMNILNFQIVIFLNYFIRNTYLMYVHVVFSLYRFLRNDKRD